MLTVLSVAYTLAAVGPDAVGGAEQVLSALDEALIAAGHRSIVVACAGSVVKGELVPTLPVPDGNIDEADRAAAQLAAREALRAVLRREPVDVVHMHGLDFDACLPPAGPPALVTLHLPLAWYSAPALRPRRASTWLHCVSGSQAAAAPRDLRLLPPIPNGVDAEALGTARHGKRGYALLLGRICPEKGVDLALEAAHLAGLPLLIGGAVFPYPEHRRYFEAEVAPRLGQRDRFLGPVGFARKRRLLAAARCLLVPSRAPETSSLVAMEALACGTPVIAFRAGALAEIVEDGRTGFLVDDVAGMARAIARAPALDPELCRAVAHARFARTRMVASYIDRYRVLAARAAA